jgi:phosphoribosyl 1,2-cyclic phosphodiesterase
LSFPDSEQLKGVSMELEFWGTRGTCPVSGKDKVKYGGHTACASLTAPSGEVIIIDAGTGLRDLGRKLAAEHRETCPHLHLLLTHFHLDHVMGLPFFAPFYSDKTTMTFYTDEEPEEAERLLTALMAGRLFPLALAELRSTRHFRKLHAGSLEIGGVRIKHHPLNHPQGSLAFRLEGGESSVVFATDTEHPLKGVDEALAEFCRKAGHLIYDATFTPEDYEAGKRGWGHSTWEAGTRLAEAAAVGRLYLSHLNPDFSDRQVDEIVRQARRHFPRTFALHPGMLLSI